MLALQKMDTVRNLKVLKKQYPFQIVTFESPKSKGNF